MGNWRHAPEAQPRSSYRWLALAIAAAATSLPSSPALGGESKQNAEESEAKGTDRPGADLPTQAPANPVKPLDDVMTEGFFGLLKSVTQNQDRGKARDRILSLRTNAPSRDGYWLHVAATGKPPKVGAAKVNNIRNHFRGELSFVGQQNLKELPVVDQLDSAFRFEFNLSGGSEGTTPKPTVQKQPVRYGLVLEEIRPVTSREGPLWASRGTDGDQVASASKADVHWTIGPVSPERDLVLHHRRTPARGTASDSAGSTWRDWDLPSARFQGDVRPLNIQQWRNGRDKMAYRAQLQHADELYVWKHENRVDGKDPKTRHRFQLPVTEHAKLGRSYNESWKPRSFSLRNLRWDDGCGRVNLVYKDQKRSVDAKAVCKRGASEWKVTATRSLPTSRKGTREKYNVSYVTSF